HSLVERSLRRDRPVSGAPHPSRMPDASTADHRDRPTNSPWRRPVDSARLAVADITMGSIATSDRATVVSGSSDAGAGTPARTASSCAANATPRNSATEDRFAQSSRAKIPVNGPYVVPNDAPSAT